MTSKTKLILKILVSCTVLGLGAWFGARYFATPTPSVQSANIDAPTLAPPPATEPISPQGAESSLPPPSTEDSPRPLEATPEELQNYAPQPEDMQPVNPSENNDNDGNHPIAPPGSSLSNPD